MQVQEAIYNGSSVVNPGYFDVPICDKYSNKPQPRILTVDTEFDVNKNIRKIINNNKGEYLVNQIPTIPSASLYYETDDASSSYYNPKYINKFYNVTETFDNQENSKYKFFIIILLIIIVLFILYCCKK